MSREALRKASTKAPARRRGSREVVRGEPVVQRVLSATLEQLARAGYKALRMEDVALCAGVNKTTVYRRWPEKCALVREALSTLAADVMVIPATGSLRGDLIALGRRMADAAASCRGQSVMRVLVAEGPDSEVAALKRSMRKTHESIPLAVIAAAVERGELAAGVDHTELFDAFMGALHHKTFLMNEKISDGFIERLVDMLLYGALRRGGARGRERVGQ